MAPALLPRTFPPPRPLDFLPYTESDLSIPKRAVHPCPGNHPDPSWPCPVHPKPYLNAQKVPGNGGGSPGSGTSYLISVWPPAFRAICTSSFPYRSSAWALQEQSMGIASPPVLLAMAPSKVCDRTGEATLLASGSRLVFQAPPSES